MSSRLIEVFLPEDCREQVEVLVDNHPKAEAWYEPLAQQQLWVRLFVDASEAEDIVDRFADAFQDVDEFRLMLLEVEASLPAQKFSDSDSADSDPSDEATLKESLSQKIEAKLRPETARINREEIYDRVAQSAQLSWIQLSLILLSSTIAAIGILNDSQAVVIGAMVIAPLLRPNMGLAVATTLGDTALAWRTVKTGLLGIAIALIFSTVIGFFATVSLESSEIAGRIQVSWPDGVLAFASGMAGAIALTSEERSSIVGVMVSVALLPPLVVLGLLLGAGYWSEAFGASLLVAANLVCLNLAAVTTLMVQDLRPREWQNMLKAKRLTRAAYGIWTLLLMGLVGIVITARFYDIKPY